MERVEPKQYKTYINSKGNKAYKYLFYCSYCQQNIWRHYDRGKLSKSCNCMQRIFIAIAAKKRSKYDDYKSTLNNYWSQMKGQCYQKNNKAFKFHGAISRVICEDWKDYRIFKRWSMQNGYKKGYSLHLIDVRLDYSPDNCEWLPIRADIKHRLIKLHII